MNWGGAKEAAREGGHHELLVVVMVMASALLKIPDQNNDSCAVSRLVFLPPQCNICATPVVLPILHREDKKKNFWECCFRFR